MNKSTYKFYQYDVNDQKNTLIYVTDDIPDALMYAGELFDLKDGYNYYIIRFENEIPIDEYTLQQFITCVSPFEERKLTPTESEIIDHMDRAELREAVRSCPTEIILEELASRCAWMEKKINSIYDLVCESVK